MSDTRLPFVVWHRDKPTWRGDVPVDFSFFTFDPVCHLHCETPEDAYRLTQNTDRAWTENAAVFRLRHPDEPSAAHRSVM